MKVEEVLVEQKIPFKQSPADFIVKCLNPEHEDNNPSMRIDKITGIFNCFSCGFKGNIFKHFDKESNFRDIQRERIKQKIAKIRAESVGLQMPKDIILYQGNERNIKPETYKLFEAFISFESHFKDRIVFPIRDITGKIVGFNGRLKKNSPIKDQPKYLYYPPKMKLPFYPTHAKPINDRIILVEGIYDMINLWDKGLTNTMCAFGTHNVDEQKLELLRMRGVDQLDICFDTDQAGRKATEKTIELCEKVGLKYEDIDITGLGVEDPGDLTQQGVNELREALYIKK